MPPSHPLRGYSAAKVEENISAEIMCVIAEEARENYREEIVHMLTSDSDADLEGNVERAVSWVTAYEGGHKNG